MMVEVPEDTRQLSWSIEDNLPLRTASLMRGMQQVWCNIVFAYRSVPLPEPLRLTEIAVAMCDYILPHQTSTAGISSPTRQAAPVAPAVEGTCVADLKEDMWPGEGSRFP